MNQPTGDAKREIRQIEASQKLLSTAIGVLEQSINDLIVRIGRVLGPQPPQGDLVNEKPESPKAELAQDLDSFRERVDGVIRRVDLTRSCVEL